MYVLIVTFLGGLYGTVVPYVGRKGASEGIIAGLLLGLVYAVGTFIEVCSRGKTMIWEWSWVNIGPYNLKINFVMDELTVLMSMLILGITALVMIYSIGYMGKDPNLVKFISYLSFFCFCMLLLVTSGNFIQLFIGWEGVGLASYLLISFWTTRNYANQAALKAVIVNRIGDVCFLFALGIIGVVYKTFDFAIIFLDFPNINKCVEVSIVRGLTIETSTIIAGLLAVAACAKSSQILLHTWLPDAMEGPTPVSSLLHSATMVTAGVFVIIRCSPIFANVSSISYILALMGIMTAVISGIIGVNQYDLKKIIAYSTCSQLGFMFFGVGLGYYNYALFHLITHAFFKCLLFLCAGSIIHALGDEQDIRKMGGLCFFLPITGVCMLIGTLALIGFPMLSGFYSKDGLLEAALNTPIIGTSVYFLAVFSVFLTSFYAVRVLYFCFYNEEGSITKGNISNIEESPFSMLFPMVVLALLSIFSGFFLKEILIGVEGSIFLQNSIYMSPSSVLFESENMNSLFMQHLPTMAALAGVLCVLVYYSSYNLKKKSYGTKYSLLYTSKLKFNFDSIYNILFSKSSFIFGYIQYKLVDRGVLEKIGPGGVYNGITNLVNRFFHFFSYGYLLHSLLIILSVSFITVVMCISL